MTTSTGACLNLFSTAWNLILLTYFVFLRSHWGDNEHKNLGCLKDIVEYYLKTSLNYIKLHTSHFSGKWYFINKPKLSDFYIIFQTNLPEILIPFTTARTHMGVPPSTLLFPHPRPLVRVPNGETQHRPGLELKFNDRPTANHLMWCKRIDRNRSPLPLNIS